MLLKYNNISFFIIDYPYFVDAYVQYIVKLISNFIVNNPNLCINIGIYINHFNRYNFNNNYKTVNISVNLEHTIVKNAKGFVSDNLPKSFLQDENGENYLVRIDHYNNHVNSDIVIDYSMPNIKNCEYINAFPNKHIYTSSSIYDFYFIKENRDIQILTTFINVKIELRRKLLNDIKNKNLPHVNVNNCFKEEELKNLYKRTKILINIHQAHYCHTFEELRVLPALELGVIVISEKSPLVELLPYYNYIIWTSYENILDVTTEVMNNYDSYHNLIFKNNNIEDVLSGLKIDNQNTLNKKLMDSLKSSEGEDQNLRKDIPKPKNIFSKMISRINR
jgi:hypothetical protein